MGLLPLEFTDCLQDSPYFRDRLHSHEKELERTSQAIKELIKEVKSLIHAAKNLSQAQRRLSQRLVDFKFECIGSRQTDDEIIIASSLKEFGKLIAAIEDEKDRMLERAYEQFIQPLEEFRSNHIGAVKERKKKFEKQTAKFCTSQERYLGLSTKKQDTVLQEADATLEMEQRDFIRAGLEYVYLIQEVQERKKFEFVETLLAFMYGWLTFYHQGHEVALDFSPHMQELQSRIQKTRESFNASREDIRALMRKMLEVRNSKTIDPGTLNKLYTRSGYLFLMEKKALGTTWNKYYCHYQKEGRSFCMIPYNQTTPKIVSNETFQIKACIKRVSESIDKRFCFDIIPEERPSTTYTFQALSEEDRELWLDAMDGKEAMYVLPPRPSDANQTFLDEAGFHFIEKCFAALEGRGLEEQGLYRVVGVSSKVTKLLTIGLDRRKSEKLNFEDNLEWESKTITSAIKTFFRNLPEPIMTFKHHSEFIAAAKLETYEDRVNEVHRLVSQLPEPNKRMLELLLQHLEKVATNAEKNMMNVSNLGVCFGPTLLRAEEESVAAIMDIKFGNVVVEILIENWRIVVCGDPLIMGGPTPLRRVASQPQPSGTGGSGATGGPTSPTLAHQSSSRLSVLPSPSRTSSSSLRGINSPPTRPPPPYQNPPPPPPPNSTAVAALAQAVIDNNGPKQAFLATKKSPPSQAPPPPPSQSSSYATWERPFKHTVPPPLASAPVGGSSVISASVTGAALGPVSLAAGTDSVKSEQQLLRKHSGGVEYPPLAPRPQISPRPRGIHVKMQGSSSSSVDSLTSGSSSRGGAMMTSQSELANSSTWSPPVAQPRSLLTGSSSAPLSGSTVSSAGLHSSHIHNSPPKPTDSSMTGDPSSPPIAKSSDSVDHGDGNEYRTVRTLYACVAEHETELSFEPNQIITKVRPSLEPGWLEGSLEGKMGLVPENYVEFLT